MTTADVLFQIGDPGYQSTRQTETRHHPLGKTCWHYSQYGMPCDEYDALRDRANGHCEICGIAEGDTPRGMLVIDHFHGWRAGFIRGLLCDKCNSGVMSCHDGLKIWGENRRWQAKAIEYERNSWQEPSELAREDMSLRRELYRQSDPRYVSQYVLYKLATYVPPPPAKPKQSGWIPLLKGEEAIAERLREYLNPEAIVRLANLLAATTETATERPR